MQIHGRQFLFQLFHNGIRAGAGQGQGQVLSGKFIAAFRLIATTEQPVIHGFVGFCHKRRMEGASGQQQPHEQGNKQYSQQSHDYFLPGLMRRLPVLRGGCALIRLSISFMGRTICAVRSTMPSEARTMRALTNRASLSR